MIHLNAIYNMDCLQGMAEIPDNSIDLILCDLPYQITNCKWDVIIPFEALWSQYNRIIKPNRAIILTASQPFTTALISSNLDMFKYALVWNKRSTTGFLQAKRQPLRQHEDVVIFGNGTIQTYNPQMTERGKPRKKGGHSAGNKGVYNKYAEQVVVNNIYHPTSIIEFSNANQRAKVHPTQKPVELFEYLIRTYSNEGDTVLDNCIGSGTTAIACINTNRNFIGYELNSDYFQLATNRIQQHTHKS